MTENSHIKDEAVALRDHTLGELFEFRYGHDFGRLIIPDYQRIYCWEEKQVYKLLDDIAENKGRIYHLGCIILHKKDKELAIVDGQQRLVTLSLILKELGDNSSPLLQQRFESELAQRYVGYNSFLINSYKEKNKLDWDTKELFKNLKFSVLIIKDENIDLAYTFFSNQNSRGKALTDFELLKAHHLRFVYIENQAIHLAERWDGLLTNSGDEANDKDKDLNRIFGIYLFRLRKWMRKRIWNDSEKFKVKTEFEAALTIDDIPPFGEQFKFNESIQGGTHFFAYAEHFVFQYKIFSQLQVIQLLRKYLSNETHWWYKDVIESLLFAYFLKFGSIYMSEAFVCVEKIISNHRYSLGRSSLRGLLEYVGNTEIVMMIDQATSPTFFLAEAFEKIKKFPKPEKIDGIRVRYSTCVEMIRKEICKSIVIEKLNL